jgi:hypothetical protein
MYKTSHFDYANESAISLPCSPTAQHPYHFNPYYCINTFIALCKLTQHLKTNGITYAHYNSHTNPTEHHEEKEEPELVEVRNIRVIHSGVPKHLRTSGKQTKTTIN